MSIRPSDLNTRVALGTVQFGLDYGISNTSGKVDTSEVKRILEFAGDSGIDTLDTAIAYGESEVTLGETLSDVATDFQVISKLRPDVSPCQVLDQVDGSLKRLNQRSIYGFLTHRFEDFKRQEIRDQMKKAKERNLIQKIGVSLYEPEEVTWLLENEVQFDLIQFPYSIFDQRFSGVMQKLKAHDVEIHVRSVYLQGLFFIKPEQLDDQFQQVKPVLSDLRCLSRDFRVPVSVLALNFVLSNPFIDKVVLGVARLDELRENLSAFDMYDRCEPCFNELKKMRQEDKNILLPFNWSKK